MADRNVNQPFGSRTAGPTLIGFLGVCALLGSWPCHSAEAENAESAFRATVLHQARYLHDFSAEDDIRGVWTNGRLQLASPSVRTLGAFTTDKVTIHAGAVELSGHRQTARLYEDGSAVLEDNPEHVTIHIDLGGNKPAAVLPVLLEALFFTDVAQTRQGLEAVHAPMTQPASQANLSHEASKCDCADPRAGGCDPDTPQFGMKGFRPARGMESVQPEIPEETRKAKRGPSAELFFEVDADGQLNNLWLMRGTGLGFDLSAARAIQRAKFFPATCHDVPVSSAFSVGVQVSSF